MVRPINAGGGGEINNCGMTLGPPAARGAQKTYLDTKWPELGIFLLFHPVLQRDSVERAQQRLSVKTGGTHVVFQACL